MVKTAVNTLFINYFLLPPSRRLSAPRPSNHRGTAFSILYNKMSNSNFKNQSTLLKGTVKVHLFF